MMDWSESSSFSIVWKAACARRVHREIKENPETTSVNRLNRIPVQRLGAQDREHAHIAARRLRTLGRNRRRVYAFDRAQGHGTNRGSREARATAELRQGRPLCEAAGGSPSGGADSGCPRP